MGFHTYDVERADALEDPTRYQYLSVDELLALFGPGSDQIIADLGSGTGFYTDDVAPYVETVYAIDIQEAMHDRYREKGMPENVEPLTARVDDLPFDEDELDGAFSTMTYHEFATDAAVAELARVLRPGARLGIGDWTAEGTGNSGPPVAERFVAEDARDALDAVGFTVERAEDRRETFVVAAHR